MFRWTLYDLDSSVTQVLTKDPRGYEDLTLTHTRDDKWHGVHYNFSNEFGFFCKGAGKELVDAAYDLKGQEASVKIKLEVKCNGEFETLLNGKLNFSTYRQEYRSGVLYTFLNAENENIVQTLKNREDMEVDLLRTTSLNGTALNSYPYLGYDINLHSKVIRLESEWESVYHGCCFRLISTGLRLFYIIPTTNIIKGNFTETLDTDSRCVNPTVFDGFLDDAQPIVNTNNSTIFVQQNTVRVSWNIAGHLTITTYDVTPVPSNCEDTCGTGALNDVLFDSVDFTLRLYFGNDSDTSAVQEADDCGSNPVNQEGIKYIDLVTIPTFVSGGNPDIKYFANSGTRDIIMNPGDKVWYYWVADLNLVSSCDMKIEFNYSASELNLLSDTVKDSTSCKSIAIHEAWSRLSEIITDQSLAFYSEFFGRTDSNINYASDGCGSKVAITSGKNIRRFTDAPILPSLKSMFDSCNAVWGIGIGIEKYQGFDVVRCEEVDYFYSQNEILKLDNVPNIQMRHLEEKVYNEINLGFQKWQTENVNGLDEPLTRINYVVPVIKQNKQKFDALSPFVAGMYAIELTRRVVEETKDSKYDEDLFFLCLNDNDLTVCEKDEKFNAITGLISPETAYNLRFMLSMTFDRLKNQFVGGLTKLGTLANPIVMPAEMEGNDNVTYQYVDGCAGDGFGSNQSNGRAGRYPHAFAQRDNPIWFPEEYTFDYPLEFDKYLTLVSNPYGLVRFSNTDKNHLSGWITNLEYNVRNKSGTFTILRNSGFEQ